MPDVQTYDFDGDRSISLSWSTSDGSTSASPAHELAFRTDRDEPSAAVRERVLNALELPGELLDYHFAMQGAAELLYRRRRTEPGSLAFVEWLAWYDVRLVEAHESLFRISPHRAEYLSVFAFDFLVELHEREGYLHEALALAERFAHFRVAAGTFSELRDRVALLRSEDV